MRVRFPPSRPSRCGSIWLEHRVRDAGTAGSNPATSTNSQALHAGRASWRRRLAYTQVSHGFDSLAPYHRGPQDLVDLRRLISASGAGSIPGWSTGAYAEVYSTSIRLNIFGVGRYGLPGLSDTEPAPCSTHGYPTTRSSLSGRAPARQAGPGGFDPHAPHYGQVAEWHTRRSQKPFRQRVQVRLLPGALQ